MDFMAHQRGAYARRIFILIADIDIGKGVYMDKAIAKKLFTAMRADDYEAANKACDTIAQSILFGGEIDMWPELVKAIMEKSGSTKYAPAGDDAQGLMTFKETGVYPTLSQWLANAKAYSYIKQAISCDLVKVLMA